MTTTARRSLPRPTLPRSLVPARAGTGRTRSALAAARDAGAALLELALPVECPGCGRPGVPVCATCLAVLGGPPRQVRPRAWPNAPPVWTAASYEAQTARLVLAWKERGRHDLARPLGSVLARVLMAALPVMPAATPEVTIEVISRDTSRVTPRVAPEEVLLVPVPSSRAAQRRRGEAHVCRLAAAGIDVARGSPGTHWRMADVLALRRRVADQAELSAAARASNLSGAFVLRSRPSSVAERSVVIVDDVVTTGATLAEAAAVLSAAGARILAACTVCATPRRHGVSAASHLH